MRKFQPGDHVELRHRKDDPEPYATGVLLFETEDSRMPCMAHPIEEDHDCWEWSNVILDMVGPSGPPEGRYSTHVGECRMRLSEFGEELREY